MRSETRPARSPFQLHHRGGDGRRRRRYDARECRDGLLHTLARRPGTGRAHRGEPASEQPVTGGASGVGLVVSTFLASAVEFVEAFTIVLAMGLTRGWRSALWGVGLAVAALAAITAVAGYALVQWFPKTSLQLVVGVLLLIFGLQWLQK